MQPKQNDDYPVVSVIIAAYNEEKAISGKILNSLALDYPKEKLEIIIASDCSTDRTHEIVKGFAQDNIKLSVAAKRAGKTAGRNRVVPVARGDIIVMSDATSHYQKDALKKLIRNFSDERIGCVGGILSYIDPSGSLIGEGEGLYWKYEVMIRKIESKIGQLTSVSGAIYAVRKELFREIPEALADDLIMPLTVRKLGYRSIYEPEAVCIEETTKNNSEEWNKRKRIAVRNIMGLAYMRELLNPFKYGFFALQLISHKVCRLLVPLFLIAVFIVNAFLVAQSKVYLIFMCAQVVFYCLALLGNLVQKLKKKNKLLFVPLYFCVTNLGILMGIVKFLKKENEKVWEPVR
jgi:cellulose synthase/poly-beta-1,6-N-acetylglucosamine synthase-like glycosyltransferase